MNEQDAYIFSAIYFCACAFFFLVLTVNQWLYERWKRKTLEHLKHISDWSEDVLNSQIYDITDMDV